MGQGRCADRSVPTPGDSCRYEPTRTRTLQYGRHVHAAGGSLASLEVSPAVLLDPLAVSPALFAGVQDGEHTSGGSEWIRWKLDSWTWLERRVCTIFPPSSSSFALHFPVPYGILYNALWQRARYHVPHNPRAHPPARGHGGHGTRLNAREVTCRADFFCGFGGHAWHWAAIAVPGGSAGHGTDRPRRRGGA